MNADEGPGRLYEMENPYQPPGEAVPVADRGSPFTDSDGGEDRLAVLEGKVRLLERRINDTRLVSPRFFLRMLAVWGYWILGYILLVAIVFAFMALMRAL